MSSSSSSSEDTYSDSASVRNNEPVYDSTKESSFFACSRYPISHSIEVLLNGDFSDVKLVVGEKTFSAHRLILAARSHYFRAMFYGSLKESKEEEITLHNTPEHAFALMLKYLYSGDLGRLIITHEHLIDLLGLAHQYGVEDLEALIIAQLKDILSPCTFCTVFSAAILYSSKKLLAKCSKMIKKNSAPIVAHEDFLTLSPANLKSFVHYMRNGHSKKHVMRVLIKWLEANPKQYETFTSELKSLDLTPIEENGALKIVKIIGVIPAKKMRLISHSGDPAETKSESSSL